ncbi:TadE/TadG family type IV pilus assembly protein [Cohnella luojiensis]|uniref:Pilus assembly protein n=1 Tax=Cohnella luojiensis TaxID=652876 RepID=A0A4Y8M2D8_9BACL|nr:TadE family protein [Cohnella luojiensis]TFE28199.1 pilus assembly protein [Cohnella luojiensis]
MKRHIPQISLINKKRRSFAADSGGLTLETALVMPVFLMIVMFLIFMVQTAVISMALHGALSQTARQAASAWYPISLALEQARASELNQQIESWNSKWLNVAEILDEYGEWLPSPMTEWAEQASKGSVSLEQGASKLAFSQLMKQFLDDDILDSARLTLTEVGLPDEVDRGSAYLTIEAEYELPVQVPFLGRKLILKESARERAWIGGSPSMSRVAEDGKETFNVSFVSLEPNPVRPGRKATLVIRTTPGAVIDLTIIYKSGLSQAKHLGSATADASGLVSWTWHVSGRTTPGQWNWQVSNAEGGIWTQSFEVAGKTTTDFKEVEQ